MTDVGDAPPPQIPATVIGGYLGAGKTTLVNQLLREADGLRLAVLVNDFGELPIDADLIESQTDQVINIAGGCVCCSFGSDLIASLRAMRDMAPRPDHLLIEASGVSLPAAIAESVTLVADFRLDGVVVLADAETVEVQSRDKYFADTMRQQLGRADLILLNKCDLPSEAALGGTVDWLRADFPSAAVVQTVRARVPMSVVLGARMAAGPASGAESSGDLRFTGHPAYGSAILTLPVIDDPEAIARTLASAEAGLLRAKGHVRDRDGTVFSVQTVGRRFDVHRVAEAPRSVGQIVVIASDPKLDAARIERVLDWSRKAMAR